MPSLTSLRSTLWLLTVALAVPRGGAPAASPGGDEGPANASREAMRRPPRRPPVPEVRDTGWVANPVDAFVLAALEARGLSPSPPAGREAWLRRVTYDLVGRPPSFSTEKARSEFR